MKFLTIVRLRQADESLQLCLCLTCGAIVVEQSMNLHETWHEKHASEHDRRPA